MTKDERDNQAWSLGMASEPEKSEGCFWWKAEISISPLVKNFPIVLWTSFVSRLPCGWGGKTFCFDNKLFSFQCETWNAQKLKWPWKGEKDFIGKKSRWCGEISLLGQTCLLSQTKNEIDDKWTFGCHFLSDVEKFRHFRSLARSFWKKLRLRDSQPWKLWTAEVK